MRIRPVVICRVNLAKIWLEDMLADAGPLTGSQRRRHRIEPRRAPSRHGPHAAAGGAGGVRDAAPEAQGQLPLAREQAARLELHGLHVRFAIAFKVFFTSKVAFTAFAGTSNQSILREWQKSCA